MIMYILVFKRIHMAYSQVYTIVHNSVNVQICTNQDTIQYTYKIWLFSFHNHIWVLHRFEHNKIPTFAPTKNRSSETFKKIMCVLNLCSKEKYKHKFTKIDMKKISRILRIIIGAKFESYLVVSNTMALQHFFLDLRPKNKIK